MIENFIKPELLSDNAPYMQVLKNELEKSDKKLDLANISLSKLGDQLNKYEYATWVDRLKYLFWPNRIT